jgi:hypothetical protein
MGFQHGEKNAETATNLKVGEKNNHKKCLRQKKASGDQLEVSTKSTTSIEKHEISAGGRGFSLFHFSAVSSPATSGRTLAPLRSPDYESGAHSRLGYPGYAVLMYFV